VGIVLLHTSLSVGMLAWLSGWVMLLVVLAAIDLRTQEVPLDYCAAALLCGVGYRVAQQGWHDGGLFALAGLAAGAGSILIIIGTWKLLTRTDGMGIGDAWILAAIGALVGFPLVLAALFIAVLSGSFVGIGMLLTRRGVMETAIPFGPFLVLGAFVTVWWAEPLMQFYLRNLLWV